ncbi:MAG: internal scaffolding protein [Wigfec virus K19_141]|nr:MAG: internal scaffolding protein [Wigfec virus K19_141]
MKTKRKRVTYHSDLPSKTQQHMKETCDINCILKKYQKTGMLSHVSNSKGQYGDFSKFSDFQNNLNQVKEAMHSFDALPSHVRKRFGNDPSQLLDFVYNPENREEAEKLGLVPKKAEAPQLATNDDKTTNTPPNPAPAT